MHLTPTELHYVHRVAVPSAAELVFIRSSSTRWEQLSYGSVVPGDLIHIAYRHKELAERVILDDDDAKFRGSVYVGILTPLLVVGISSRFASSQLRFLLPYGRLASCTYYTRLYFVHF